MGDVRVVRSEKNFKEKEKVSSNTLDHYVSRELINKNSLLFIDVQGHEPKVFRGSKIIINKKIPIVFEFDTKLMPKNYLRDFQILFDNYKFFFDLHNNSKKKIIFNKENIQNLEKKLKDNYTDLMIV